MQQRFLGAGNLRPAVQDVPAPGPQLRARGAAVSAHLLAAHDPLTRLRRLLAIGLMASLTMRYHLRSERTWDVLYGVFYAYYAFFALFWIFPCSADGAGALLADALSVRGRAGWRAARFPHSVPGAVSRRLSMLGPQSPPVRRAGSTDGAVLTCQRDGEILQ